MYCGQIRYRVNPKLDCSKNISSLTVPWFFGYFSIYENLTFSIQIYILIDNAMNVTNFFDELRPLQNPISVS